MIRILVLGGYGNFGKRICRYLAKKSEYAIIIAGRDRKKAQAWQKALQLENPHAHLDCFVIDIQSKTFQAQLQNTQAQCVIHTAGPFQGMDYHVPRACIELGMHYVDIADARKYVVNITSLDELAKEKNAVIISGASSVPALSSAIVDHFSNQFSVLREIEFGISPGNRVERGNATIAAILDYTGKPFTRLERGHWVTVYGWQDAHRRYYGDNLGLRWHANCDIPDLELFPQHYPQLETVAFYAGLEVGLMHFLMWHMSWITRAKIIKNWRYFRRPIIALSNLFNKFGTDKGGMLMRLYGTNQQYQPLEITWTLIAEHGHGPNIPIIPAVIMVEKILKGEIEAGARPCFNMITLAEFDHIAAEWSIYHHTETREM